MKKIRKTDVRPIKDLRDLLQQACSLYGSKNAFYIKDDSQNYKGITYNEFKNDVDALGTAFLNRGLKDKFIAVMSENRYEWCVTYLATANGVGVIVPPRQGTSHVRTGKSAETFKRFCYCLLRQTSRTTGRDFPKCIPYKILHKYGYRQTYR